MVVVNDTVPAGPASVSSTLAEPYALTAGAVLTLTVGTGTAVDVTFAAGDFANIGTATYAEVVAVLEAANIAGLEPFAASEPLTFTTTAVGTGAAASITLAGTALGALGFSAGTTSGSAEVAAPAHYVKQGDANDAAWHDSSGAAATIATLLAAGTVDFLRYSVEAVDADGYRQLFEDLGLSNLHPGYIGSVLGLVPPRRAEQLENLVALTTVGTPTPFALRQGLTAGADAQGRSTFRLGNGTDGGEPLAERFAEALAALDALEGVSIIAAPGSSALPNGEAIRGALIANAEARGTYRIAVLDGPPAQTISQIRDVRATMDSDHAALYHPWIVVANPDARPGDRNRPLEIAVPPAGHVCGIYARNDAERGVHKAPANEVVLGALRFESNVTMGQQEVLNPEGINVLRSFRGRGHRVWGARLASSDPEFRYVNVRRFFNYISATLDRGTQWVVFEPNNEQLWERVTATVSDFLYDEWTSGALLGRTQDEAFFVRCGRSTMTQSDIDNGRLICEVGMAIVYPAEFVIFRIGQKTATSNS